jgi:hypothetical protein
MNAGFGRHLGIAEPMVLDELAALRPIRSGLIRVQNRRQRLTRNAHLIVQVSWVGDPVERSIIPVRIVEDEVLEEENSNLCVMVGLLRRRRLGRNAERPVIGFAAPLKWRVVVVLLHHLISARADISDCFHLLCPKAVQRLLRSLAQKLLGIEGAASGIIQDAIDDTIKSIAINVDGVAEQRIFISKTVLAGLLNICHTTHRLPPT